MMNRYKRFAKDILLSCRIFFECVHGFWTFRSISGCITIFGSARFKEGHPFYTMAYELGQLLAIEHLTVITGGGPGLMEAVSKGAKKNNGTSIGCNIKLAHEEKPNHYLDKRMTCKYFFARKIMLTKYSSACIILPGGLGTLDELFEMATLVQTGKLKNFPLVLMGVAYWTPLIDFLQEMLVGHNTIDQQDVDRLLITDSPKEAVEFIKYTRKDMSDNNSKV